MKNILLYPLLFLLLLAGAANAQAPVNIHHDTDSFVNAPPPLADRSGAEPINPKENVTAATPVNPFKSVDFLLSITVLCFGLVVIILEVILSVKRRIEHDHVMKIIILTMVITASVVLITAGYSNNQITGVSGILGSIAGYMLGKTDLAKPTPAADPDPTTGSRNQIAATTSNKSENEKQ